MENKSTGLSINLIIKLTGEKEFWKIKRLDFYSKSNKIKRIENLDECINLQELNLSYNYISKIENLSTLINLKTLDLSENSIKKFENLNALVSLEYLNLAGNLLKEIEKDSISSLISLNFLNISKNKIARLGEFGNLSVLENIESICTAGNLVKQSDLKEFLPIKLPKLKYIDGAAISNSPSENASTWVKKDNLKGLKLELIKKSKELSLFTKDLSEIKEKIKTLEKVAPDKKYMKELLDKADILHNASVNLQQSMAENREILDSNLLRLETIKDNERSTGNFLVEEIRLTDESKKIKETIEEHETQYGLVLEELEKIAVEITKIDNIINNTPKFKTNEFINLELKSKELVENIKLCNEEIENIKEKIDECCISLGIADEEREFNKIMDVIWKKLTDDIIKECKRWSNDVCKAVDKERCEFALISSRNAQEIHQLEQKIENMTKNTKEEQGKNIEKHIKNIELKDLNKQGQEIKNNEYNKERIFNLEKTYKEKQKELEFIESCINEKSLRLQDIDNAYLTESIKKYENSKFKLKNNEIEDLYAIFSKISEVLSIPMNVQVLLIEITKILDKFQNFKRKKKQLIGSYQQKNQEIQEKIKYINKERGEIENEKKTIKDIKDELKICETEIIEKEKFAANLQDARNKLENESIKLSYQINTLKEECDAYNEKKFRLLTESKRLQDLFDKDMLKYEELTKDIICSENKLKTLKENYDEILKNKESTSMENDRIIKEIQSKENMLYYLETKISEEQIRLRTELETQVKITKQRESEINELNSELLKKESSLKKLKEKIIKNKNQLKNISKETNLLQERNQNYNTKIKENEEKINEIDKINHHLIEDMRIKQSKSQALDTEITEKLSQIEKIQTQYKVDLANVDILRHKLCEWEKNLEDLDMKCNIKNTELKKLQTLVDKYYKNASDIDKSRCELDISKDSDEQFTKSLTEVEQFSGQIKALKEILNKSKAKKKKLIQDISLITSEFNSKESIFTEKLKKNQHAIEISEQTLANLKVNIESLIFDFRNQEKKLEKMQQEVQSLSEQRDEIYRQCKSIKEEIGLQREKMEN